MDPGNPSANSAPENSDNKKHNSNTNNPRSTQKSGTKTQLNEHAKTPLNEHAQTWAAPQRTTQTREHESRTLIIGDSILSGINRKGLLNGVECQPMPGATIAEISVKIQLYDMTKFSNVVVYVGGNDASRNSDDTHFEEQYQQLILHVKDKNRSCNIFLCTACPRGDTDVTRNNEVIERLCYANKSMCVNVNEAFYDKQNNLRDHFYRPRDNIHLSRSGIKRLLGTIDNHIPIVGNYANCVYPIRQQSYQHDPSSGIQNSPSQQTTGRPNSSANRHNTHNQNNQRWTQENQHSREFYHTPREQHYLPRPSSQNEQSVPADTRYHSRHTAEKRPYEQGDTDYHQRPSAEPHYDPEPHRQWEQDEHHHYPLETAKYQERCLKCGLKNHVTEDCRHQTQVKCYRCKMYGHKDSSGLCWSK